MSKETPTKTALVICEVRIDGRTTEVSRRRGAYRGTATGCNVDMTDAVIEGSLVCGILGITDPDEFIIRILRPTRE